jgi:hypothetical protein
MSKFLIPGSVKRVEYKHYDEEYSSFGQTYNKFDADSQKGAKLRKLHEQKTSRSGNQSAQDSQDFQMESAD